VLCAGRSTLKWDTFCADVWQVIFSKLSLRDAARAGGTCREFEEAYLGRVAEERARLIALGKETYGEGRFRVIVTAFQRGMCGLDPWPGVVLRCREGLGASGNGGHINAAGETLVGRWSKEGAAREPRCEVWRYRLVSHVLGANVWLEVPGIRTAQGYYHRTDTVSYISLELYSTPRRGLHWRVWLKKEGAAPAIGLLLAICTENPEVLSPCFQRPGSMKLMVSGLSPGPASSKKREGQEVTGPLGLLAELLTIHPPSHILVTRLGEKVQARPRGVLKRVEVSWH
jgi:hypothetical protein